MFLSSAQRKICILDRNGKLYDEVHLPAAEVQQVARSSCATALQVRLGMCNVHSDRGALACFQRLPSAPLAA